MLERRVTLLGVLTAALASPTSTSASAPRTSAPALRALPSWPPLRAAARASSGPSRVIGPMRMDYGAAIAAVREAAARSCRASSKTSTTRPAHAPRPLRGARRRAGRRRRRDQEGVPQARPRAAPGRQPGRPATPRRSSRRPPRPTRCSPTASGARLRPLRPRRPAQRRLRPELRGLRLGLATSSTPSSAGRLRRGSAAAAARARRPVQGGDVVVAVGGRPRDAASGAHGRGLLRRVERCEHCHGNGAEPGTPIETCARCGGSGPAPGRLAHAVRPGRAHRGVRRLRRRRPRPRAAVRDLRGRGRGRAARAASHRRRPGGHRRRPAHPPRGPRPRRASAAARAATCTCVVRVREDERFCATATTSSRCSTSPAPLRRARHDGRGAAARRDVALEIPAGTQPGEVDHDARARACRRCGAAARATCACVVNVVIPRKLSSEQRELLRAARGVARRSATWHGRGHARQAQAPLARERLTPLVPAGASAVAPPTRGASSRSPSCCARAQRGRGGRPGAGEVEYAVYGAAGELPAERDVRALAGARCVEVDAHEVADDWADALARVPPAGRVGDAARARRRGTTGGDDDSSSTRAGRSARAPTRRRGCASSCCSTPSRGGALCDWGAAPACSPSPRPSWAGRR